MFLKSALLIAAYGSLSVLSSCIPRNMTYDYIIVGGGTAGLVVATRLTEDPDVKVLVVEAGADKSSDPLILTPALGTSTIGNPAYDWAFRSPPQPNLLNRVIGQPRGKQLGGSAGINLMVMMYPSQENINAWGKLGNSGWSWDTLEPYFRKMATVSPPGENAKTVVGVDEWYDPSLGGGDGPLQVTWGEGYFDNLQGAWVKAFDKLDLKMNGDPRSGNAIGGFQNMQAIHPRTKTRSYPPTAWYGASQRERENLVVLTNTLAKKIVTTKKGEDVVATGVVIQTAAGEEQLMHAKKEVILAAGVFQSPQILELSGIGSRKVLEKHSIPVVIENENVGEHLQDHAIVAQLFEIKDGVYSLDRLRDPAFVGQALQQFATNGTGPLAQAQLASAYTPFMDLNGRMSSSDVKDMLDAHLGGSGSNKEFDVLREGMEKENYNQVQYHLFPATLTAPNANGVVPTFTSPHIAAMALLSHPFSRGNVHIVSDDVADKPVWDPAFLTHPLDIEILARSIQFTEKIVSTAPFSDSLTGKRFPDIVGDTLDKAKEIVRQVTISSFHPSGSLSMRPQEDGGVVNERLVVYGTSNIRVVDASIFPLEPSGNILATVYAVAEKAADLIKEDRGRG